MKKKDYFYETNEVPSKLRYDLIFNGRTNISNLIENGAIAMLSKMKMKMFNFCGLFKMKKHDYRLWTGSIKYLRHPLLDWRFLHQHSLPP